MRLNEFLFWCRRNRAPPLTLMIFYREDNWKFIFFNHQKPVIKIGKRNGKIAFSHRWRVLGVPLCAYHIFAFVWKPEWTDILLTRLKNGLEGFFC